MESLTLFVFASIALIITPGPDIIYVLTRGITDGKLSGAISAFRHDNLWFDFCPHDNRIPNDFRIVCW